MSSITIMVDIDNEKRLTISNKGKQDTIKDAIKAFMRDGEKVQLNIKGLGVMQFDAIIPSYQQRSIIIKTSLIVDYKQIMIDNAIDDAADGEDDYE